VLGPGPTAQVNADLIQDKATCAAVPVVDGPEAVSEQSLAEKAMDALPPGSVLVGDRNFGVFSIAWQAQQRGIDVVIRLTADRARKLCGEPIHTEGDQL
jgi:hypothetical protein